MSKKHFNALAKRISEIQDPSEREAATCAVADVSADFNSKFDRERFLKACGLEV